MKLRNLTGVAATCCLAAVANTASALPTFTMNGTGTPTDPFDTIVSNIQTTSTYTAPLAVPSFDSLIGGLVAISDDGTGTVGSLNNGETALRFGALSGFGSVWGLDVTLTLDGFAGIVDGNGDGTLDADNNGLIDSANGDFIVPQYTDGTIELTYVDDGGASKKVLELKYVSAVIDGVSVNLIGDVDYTWYTAGDPDPFVENFLEFTSPVNGFTRWFDVWESSTVDNPIRIATRSDFNVDPNRVPTSTCVDDGDEAGCNEFARSANLNVTTSTVPVPATLALLGLGLAAMGFRFRRAA